jgi:Peptidase family M23
MRRTRVGVLVAFAVAGVLALGSAHPAAGAATWLRPVAGPVARGFRAPLTRYGAGHLGVDFAAVPGTPVRAAGAGTIAFAGVVAHTRHVMVRHAGGLRTSYSFLASIRVHVGAVVARGAVLGTTGGTGERHAAGVLHFGLRIGDEFVDPMQLFTPGGPPALVHLAPLGPTSGSSRGLGAERPASVVSSAEAVPPVGPPVVPPVVLAVVLPGADAEAQLVRAPASICVRLVALRRSEPGRGPLGAVPEQRDRPG